VKKLFIFLAKSTFFHAEITFFHAGITFVHAAASSVKKSNSSMKKSNISVKKRGFFTLASMKKSRFKYCSVVSCLRKRPCDLMEKASDFGSKDCRFEYCHGRFFSRIKMPKPFFSFMTLINKDFRN
jgi:hypothetical protein